MVCPLPVNVEDCTNGTYIAAHCTMPLSVATIHRLASHQRCSHGRRGVLCE